MCIHTIWYLSWLSKTLRKWQCVSKEKAARQNPSAEAWLHLSSKKADKRKERHWRGMDFSKNSNHESNSLQFTTGKIILLPCQQLWICKILLVFRQGPTLDDLQLSMQHWLNLLHWAHIKGQSSVKQPFTCKPGAVFQCLQPLPAFTENIQSSLKKTEKAPSARRVELPRTLWCFFYFSLQIH